MLLSPMLTDERIILYALLQFIIGFGLFGLAVAIILFVVSKYNQKKKE